MLKSRFLTVCPPDLPHLPHINFTVSLTLATNHFPKYSSVSSSTLQMLPPLSGLVFFHFHLVKLQFKCPLVHEISKSTQSEMSSLSTEWPQLFRLYPPHGALPIPNLTILTWRQNPSVLLVYKLLDSKIVLTCYNNSLQIISVIQIEFKYIIIFLLKVFTNTLHH